MVEITKNISRSLQSLFLVALVASYVVAVADDRAGDKGYAELLERTKSVDVQIEELQDDLAQHRSDYAEGKSGAQRLIEVAELKLFDLQQQRVAIEREIKASVQRRELSQIGSVEAGATERQGSVVELEEGDEGVATLSQSRMLRSILSADDLEQLRRADGEESRLWEIFIKSVGGHSRLVEMAQQYAQTKKESEALEIEANFGEVAPVVDSLFGVLSKDWSKIYDHKSYCYAVLLESLDRDDVLLAGEQILRDGASGVELEEDNPYRFAQLYDMQKRAMLRYESSVAQDLGFVVALDSLRGALKSVTARGEVESLAQVEIVERNFIEYSDVKFSTSPIYKKASQIPVAKLYPRGRVYRLQLGAYTQQQLPSIFRGAHPLSYDKAFGYWTYYTGAFETYVEAERAQLQCRNRGFKRPEIVVWSDGKRRNYGREPLPATKGFRLIVEGVSELSPDMQTLIKAMCGDVDVSKLGATKYIVATIKIRPKADEIAEALMALNEEVVCEVVEIN